MKDLKVVKDLILQQVTLGEILKSKGLIYYALDEEQFSCPFHGADRKKSSRYYRETDSTYCWVCKERLDLFSWMMKQEGLSFSGVINSFVSTYRIDLSKLPDTIEKSIENHYKKDEIKISARKVYTEKLSNVIHTLKYNVDFDQYKRLVLGYMMLKYMIPDERFSEQAMKLKDAVLKTAKGSS